MEQPLLMVPVDEGVVVLTADRTATLVNQEAATETRRDSLADA
jgi:hypothetical protein